MANQQEDVLSTLLSLFFPLRCVHCGSRGARLCAACEAGLKSLGPHTCSRCGKPCLYGVGECNECRGRRLDFEGAAAAYAYQGPARSLVRTLKYSGQRRLAELMAELTLEQPAAEAGLTQICKAATLTYVPLYKPKQASRGYNQACLYARALARKLRLPCRELLIKKHPTLPQNQLNFSQRRNNLAGSFAVNKKYCSQGRQEERVVLVDDVYTTGSTATECARVLKQGLGADVHVWTFARTVRRWSGSMQRPVHDI
jgi:competence protein ComFC